MVQNSELCRVTKDVMLETIEMCSLGPTTGSVYRIGTQRAAQNQVCYVLYHLIFWDRVSGDRLFQLRARPQASDFRLVEAYRGRDVRALPAEMNSPSLLQAIPC